MNFSQILKKLMTENNITAYRLSKEINVHQTTVHNWLNGAIPKTPTLQRLAEYFHVEMRELLGDGRAEFNGTDSATAYTQGWEVGGATYGLKDSDFTYALQNEAKDLTDEDKRLLISMAKRLREARKARDTR